MVETYENKNFYDLIEKLFTFKAPIVIKPMGFEIQEVDNRDIQVFRLYDYKDFNILLAVFNKNSIFPKHAHVESEEHILCISGHIQIIIGDNITDLKQGNCMVIPAGIEHSALAIESSKLLGICIPPEKSYCGNILSYAR
jgi:quercetin dioxygenase-like cupin family protein